MIFSSFAFILCFLPLAFALYHAASRILGGRWGMGALVLCSFGFYGIWHPPYLAILLGSILVNWYIAREVCPNRGFAPPKGLLLLGITCNLLLLGIFKYANFTMGMVGIVTGREFGLIELALPLGISFFTFQQIAYLVDSYQGKVRPQPLLNYALFVSFFPQLIAGPIVHHSEMMSQFESEDRARFIPENAVRGFMLFGIGLVKKVAIADKFAVWASAGFAADQPLHLFEAWAAVLSYTLQIYFDFSGYTDMALGAALLFNIRLPLNFNAPYRATSIQDFWHRWHMTLSRWLRDYVYIPLGGNRLGNAKTYRNLGLVLLLGGFWHGAGFTFIVWGALHGLAMMIHRWWKRGGRSMPTALAWGMMFLFICVTWVFFRAPDFDTATNLLKSLVGANGTVLPYKLAQQLGTYWPAELEAREWLNGIGAGSGGVWAWIIAGLGLATLGPVSQDYAQGFMPTARNLVGLIVIWVLGLLMLNSVYSQEFLYFDF